MSDASRWVSMFADERFRRGWRDFQRGIDPREVDLDNRTYLYGRQMAAESGLDLPKYDKVLSYEMIEVLKSCDGLMDMLATRKLFDVLLDYCTEQRIRLVNPGDVLDFMIVNDITNKKQLAEAVQRIGILGRIP